MLLLFAIFQAIAMIGARELLTEQRLTDFAEKYCVFSKFLYVPFDRTGNEIVMVEYGENAY